MHIDNFVMFTGATVGIWQTASLMQWDGARWRPLPVGSNREKYMLALNDMTAGAPNGIFSNAFIRTLFADMAMINVLDILCTIRSANFSETDGWQLDSSGRAILRNAVIDGHINALSGFFQNVHIGSMATFEGSIRSGPLIASNEINAPTGRTWQANTTIQTIKGNLGIGAEATGTVNASGGSYGSTTGLLRLEFTRPTVTWGGAQRVIDRLRIVFPSTTFMVEDVRSPTTGNLVQGRINLALNVRFIQGKTLRFMDLPTGGGGLPAGTVWRDAGGFLRIA